MIFATLLFLSRQPVSNCFPLFVKIVGLQGKSLTLLHIVGSSFNWSSLQRNTSQYPLFANCPEFSEHDWIYWNSKAFTTCWEYLSTPVPHFPCLFPLSTPIPQSPCLFPSFHTHSPLGLHFVPTEILTCSKICTHQMLIKKCFFSQWLCSILTSHSMAFPSDKTAPWQKVTIITNMKQIHSTSCTILLPLHRDSSYILLCYWIKACVTLCVENICYDD